MTSNGPNAPRTRGIVARVVIPTLAIGGITIASALMIGGNDESASVIGTADTSAAEVSRILASYNLVSVPVVDENHRLVGVVTIDDVLDYLLPDDWRSTTDDQPSKPQQPVKGRRTPSGTR